MDPKHYQNEGLTYKASVNVVMKGYNMILDRYARLTVSWICIPSSDRFFFNVSIILEPQSTVFQTVIMASNGFLMWYTLLQALPCNFQQLLL